MCIRDSVYTGVCLRRPDGSELYDASITRVAFITLPDVLIERYVDTGEPMDKAGGYALPVSYTHLRAGQAARREQQSGAQKQR